MKLRKLKIKNFISIKHAELDFEKLKPGVFLIYGPTGSGKTAILDAIHWCLYGCTLNQNRNRVSREIASDYSGPNESPEVTLEFEQDLCEYRIVRAMNRKTGNTVIRFSTPDFIYDKVRDANRAIEKVLGLNCHQFDQMVMLEQGNFSKFLLTDSRNRADLLRNVFDTEIFQSLELNLKGRVDKLKQHIESLSALELSYLNGELLTTIKDRCKMSQETIDKLKANKTSDEERLQAHQKLLPILQEYERELRLFENAQAELAALQQRKPEIDALIAKREAHAKYSALLKTISRLEQLAETEQQLTATINECNNQLAELPELADNATILRELADSISNLKNDLSAWQHLFELKSKIAEAKTDLSNAEADIPDLIAKISKLKSNIDGGTRMKQLRFEYDTAMAKWSSIKAEYDRKVAERTGMVASWDELNERLPDYLRARLIQVSEPGTCPVCGQPWHENSDVHVDAGFDIDRYDELRTAIAVNKAWLNEQAEEIKAEPQAPCSESMTDIQNKISSWESDLRQTESALSSRRMSVDYAKRRLAEYEADNTKEPEHSVDELQKMLDDAEKRFADVENQQRAYTEIVQQKAALNARLEHAQNDLDSIRKEQSEIECPPDDVKAEVKALESDIIDFETNMLSYSESISSWQSVYATLSTVKAPTKPESELTVLQCNDDITRLTNSIQDLISEIATAENQLKNDKELVEKIESIIKEREELTPKYKETQYVYNQISGKNASKLSLENFVLHRQLEWILNTSNQYLKTLSNNQFHLTIRWEGTGRSQGGLEISIADAVSGKARPAETFSGGELFILSLSLSLGLMSSIDSLFTGLDLGVLFIDEGFGTLDAECLNRVLSTLQQLKSIDCVGIISHVQELIESIPQGFAVTKGMSGTVIKPY
jgi:exonuclease SbcC